MLVLRGQHEGATPHPGDEGSGPHMRSRPHEAGAAMTEVLHAGGLVERKWTLSESWGQTSKSRCWQGHLLLKASGENPSCRSQLPVAEAVLGLCLHRSSSLPSSHVAVSLHLSPFSSKNMSLDLKSTLVQEAVISESLT